MFTSQVARRAFVLFIACALLPVLAMSGLAIYQVTSHLQDQAQRRLQQASKRTALGLLNRLQAAQGALDQLAKQEAVRPRSTLSAALWTGEDGTVRAVFGEMTRPRLSRNQEAAVGAGKTVLSIDRDAAGRVRVILTRPVDLAQPGRGLLHAVVDPTFLWTLEEDSAVSPDTGLVVLDEAGQLLFSSLDTDPVLPEIVTRRAFERVSGHFEWRDQRREYVATHWSLFLQASFGAGKWTFVLSEPKAEVLAPVQSFERLFGLVLVLTVLTVLLASGQQIRKILTPITQLKAGADRLARGDLGARVEVTSRDEFAEVATAFNTMASQLGRQFRTLAVRQEITAAFNPSQPLQSFLQHSAEAVKRHLDDVLVVGIWLIGADRVTFDLVASAGPAGRAWRPSALPLTESELARLRAGRQPHVVKVLGDDRGRRGLSGSAEEGVTAFLAHPLVNEGKLLGCLGIFGTRVFEPTELSAFSAAGGDLARCIDRKQVDDALRDSEMQTRQLQKMEAIGRLAGGIAHDFNNLLMVITGRTYLLMNDFTAADPRRKNIATIDEAAKRAALLTRQLLAFSRKQVLAPTVLDLNEVVAGLTDILDRLVGEPIEIAFVPVADLGRTKLDRSQIEQVLVNLVVNARDAMPDGGRITVETHNVELDAAFVRGDEAGGAGPHVMLAVTDTGTGMDERTRARIFEPFFTTKEVGKGTGLGLATVHGIVQQSDGHIRVESAVGAGTTFRIYFPRVDDVIAATRDEGRAVLGGSETVLVVDDEVEVQSLLQAALAGYGYTVLGASSPGEALGLAEQHSGRIRLLLTDIVMPEMSGPALAERLAAFCPGMSTVYMSGYADYGSDVVADCGGGVHFLQKPFSPETVARTIREALDADPVAGR